MLEAILSVAVFALFLLAIGLSVIVGERSTVAAGDRTRAAFLAERSIEAVRHLRDENFDTLSSGVFHPVVSEDESWSLAAGPETRDGFLVSVALTEKEDDWFDAVSRAQWDFGEGRSGSVVLTTSLTNWRKQLVIGNWQTAELQTQVSFPEAPDFRQIAARDSYVFLAGQGTGSGTGLYVYDVSNPASPVRVASSFDLGVNAYALAIEGTDLYVLTSDTERELLHFSIAQPATLSWSNLSGSLNLPGAGVAGSIAVFSGTLYVGTTDQATAPEFATYGVTETGGIIALDTLEIGGGVTGIRLRDGYGYLATAADGGELQVVDVFDPLDLVFAPGVGMDLPDTTDALSIAVFGTSAIIGRANGSAISELTLYSVAESPLPSPPPGPWTFELGGDGNALDSDPGGTYAFVGSTTESAQFRVLDMALFSSPQNPSVRTVGLSQSLRSLVYDWQTDRVYAAGNSIFYVIRPGS